MSSRNLVILMGHLGRDPETRYTPQGMAVCTLTVATSQKWKDKQTGELREETEWSRVVLYDRKAEVAQQYLKKGSQVYIEGRLKTRKWTDKDGIERYTTEIIADQMQMLGGRNEQPSGGFESQPKQQYGQPQTQPEKQQYGRPAPTQTISDIADDIPF